MCVCRSNKGTIGINKKEEEEEEKINIKIKKRRERKKDWSAQKRTRCLYKNGEGVSRGDSFYFVKQWTVNAKIQQTGYT